MKAPRCGCTGTLRRAGRALRFPAPAQKLRAAPPRCGEPSPAPDARRARQPLRLRPVQAPLTPMDTPPPPEDQDTGYVKTRVQRFLNLPVAAAGFAVTKLRFRVPEALMMKKDCVQARLGTLFFRIRFSGELGVMLRSVWTPDGSANEVSWSSTSAAADTVGSLELWSGPVPGAVCLDIEIDNAGPGAVVVIEGDVCARGRGSNYLAGMWFRDLGRAAVGIPRPVPYEPRLDLPPSSTPKPARRERPCRPPMGRRAFVPSDVSDLPPMQAIGGPRRKRGNNSTQYTLSQMDEPAAGWPCEPDPRAEDWVAAIGAAPRGSFVHDPEAEAADALFGGKLVLRRGGAQNFPGGALRFPESLASILPQVHPASGGQEGSRFRDYLARCEGFHALWQEVTQGLEDKRLPVWTLDSMIDNGTAGPNAGQDCDTWVRRLVGEHSTSQRDWVFNVTAPWLDQNAFSTWYLASILNFVSATLDLAPLLIRSPRTGRKDAEIVRGDADWRLSGTFVPNLRVGLTFRFDSMLGFLHNHPEDFSFDAETVTISYPSSRPPPELNQEFKLNGAGGGTTPFFYPIPSRIRLFGPHTLGTASPAAQTYQIARLLTMLLASHPERLRNSQAISGATAVSDFDAILDVAKTWYRLHLGTLTVPASTLVHELFHTIGLGGPVGPGVYAKRLATGGFHHCHTGCGQEKMSSAWLQAVLEELGVGFFWESSSWPEGSLRLAREPDGNGGETVLSGPETRGGARCYWRKMNFDRTDGTGNSDLRKDGYLGWLIQDAGLSASLMTWTFEQTQDARSERLALRRAEREATLARLAQRRDSAHTEALNIQQTEPNRSNRLARRAMRLDGRVSRKRRWITRLDRVYTRRESRSAGAFERQCWNGSPEEFLYIPW